MKEDDNMFAPIVAIYMQIIQTFSWDLKRKTTNWVKFCHLSKMFYQIFTTKLRAANGHYLYKFSFKSFQKFYPEANKEVFWDILEVFRKLQKYLGEEFLVFFRIPGKWKYQLEIHPELAKLCLRIGKYAGKGTKKTCDSISFRVRTNKRGSTISVKKHLENMKKHSEQNFEEQREKSAVPTHFIELNDSEFLYKYKNSSKGPASPSQNEFPVKKTSNFLNPEPEKVKIQDHKQEKYRIMTKKLRRRGLTIDQIRYFFKRYKLKDITTAYYNAEAYMFKINNYFAFLDNACRDAPRFRDWHTKYGTSQDKGLGKLIYDRLAGVTFHHGWNRINYFNLKYIENLFTWECVNCVLKKFLEKKDIVNANAFLYDQCKKLAQQDSKYYNKKYLKSVA